MEAIPIMAALATAEAPAPATVEAETPVPAAIPETAVRAVETEMARDRLRRRMT